jgi:hypothetical protein
MNTANVTFTGCGNTLANQSRCAAPGDAGASGTSEISFFSCFEQIPERPPQ